MLSVRHRNQVSSIELKGIVPQKCELIFSLFHPRSRKIMISNSKLIESKESTPSAFRVESTLEYSWTRRGNIVNEETQDLFSVV